MCFSFEVSISTFLISWGISLYLLNKGLNKNHKQNVVALMIFSSIQLADAILWFNKMKVNNINYVVSSYIIPLILSLQIIYNVFVRNNNNKNIYITIISIIYIIYLFNKLNGYSISLNNYFKSPIWGANDFKIWEILLFTLLIFYPRWSYVYYALIWFGLVMVFANGAYGSLWCAVANMWALFYLYKY
tara:strand:+ start:93 stop:656 length:564 start_codon:yes stop_codon:yes gene_type:complete